MWILQIIRNFLVYIILLVGEGIAIVGFMLLSRDEKASFSRTAVKSINQVFRKYNIN